MYLGEDWVACARNLRYIPYDGVSDSAWPAASNGRHAQLAPRKAREPELSDDAENQEYAGAIEALKAELERLRAEVADLHKSAAEHDRPPAIAVVVADEQLGAEQGFYPVERTEDGVAFCWTGPAATFSLAIRVDRFMGADLRLDAISFLDWEKQKDVQLQADGQPVPLKVTRGGIGVIITAELAPRTGREPTTLSFTLPTTLPPANAADKRMLGLAFFKLTARARA
jgi:hypothetical protein